MDLSSSNDLSKRNFLARYNEFILVLDAIVDNGFLFFNISPFRLCFWFRIFIDDDPRNVKIRAEVGELSIATQASEISNGIITPEMAEKAEKTVSKAINTIKDSFFSFFRA